MKRKELFTFIIAVLFSATWAIQGQTVVDPNAVPTITPEEISELGNQAPTKDELIILNFEGLGDQLSILDYYDGGLAEGGFGPGPDYGVTFSGATLSIIAGYAGGSGNFQNEPSPSTIMFFLQENNAIMNVEAGFETGFSFYYSAINQPGSVEVYDEVGGEGNMLASFNLAPLGTLNIPGGAYNIWEPIGVSFEGVAKSVKFIGAANYIGFDDVTFGSEIPGEPNPTPIPLSDWAIFLGLGMIILFSLLRIKRII